MLLHAFTGCDTVSSIYGFNKGKLFKNLVESSNYTNDLFEIFIRDDSSVQEISNAGIRIFQIIYKTNGITLSKTRHYRYNKQSKVGVLCPENLPPTDSAAAQHSLRAYL